MPKRSHRYLTVIDQEMVNKCVEARNRLFSIARVSEELGLSEYAVARALKIKYGQKLPTNRKSDEEKSAAHQARLQRQRENYHAKKNNLHPNRHPNRSPRSPPPRPSRLPRKSTHRTGTLLRYLQHRRYKLNGIWFLDGKIDNCIHRRMKAVNAELKSRGMEQVGRCREWLE